MSLAEIVQSSGWKNFMSKLYGIGASVVIVGALFKIQHYPLAGTLLFIGLCTEATIFFFSAFEPLHEDPDWSLVYPELAGVPEDEEEMALQASRSSHYRGGGGGSEALAKFDEMLLSADITPDIFDKLGRGLRKFNETTANMTAMGDVTGATGEFAEKVRAAAETLQTHTQNYARSSEDLGDSLGQLGDSYKNTSKIINETGVSYKNMTESLSNLETSSKSYHDQLESVNKNLSALNAVYELQLKGSNEQMKESDELARGVQKMLGDLKSSAEDASKYRERIAKLNENLEALNTVYGNMLTAMNVK